MTILFSDGFESGDFSAWTGTNGTPTVQSEIVHHGSYAMLSSYAGSGNIRATKTISSVQEIHFRGYFQVSALPELNMYNAILGFGCDTDARGVSVGLRYTSGVQRIYYYIYGCDEGGIEYSFPVDEWVCVEVYYVSHASEGQLEIRINDEVVINRTGLNTLTAGNVSQIGVGSDFYRYVDSATNIYVDCCVVSDSYIGPEATGNFLTGNFTGFTESTANYIMAGTATLI